MVCRSDKAISTIQINDKLYRDTTCPIQWSWWLVVWKKLSFELIACVILYLGRAKRFWYLLLMRAAKVQASLRIRAVSPEPPLLAHTSSESRGTFRQKARSLALLNGWACAVKICHDGMLEDTNSLGAAHLMSSLVPPLSVPDCCLVISFVRNYRGKRTKCFKV